ncbi:hypothetical protein GCM10012278_30860 [Nonomuraea glycinis]|uniref:Uncharacterized protein n=1 Tax=Nonomuraea glycinis TaxID=2047744 RepID=A0A918A477_9ACTN|nr:hypothetical protein GCM10012278_30860 [Nonomuraea glycinis]
MRQDASKAMLAEQSSTAPKRPARAVRSRAKVKDTENLATLSETAA